MLATYSYDALDRLTSVVYSQTGQTSLTYGWAYDQTGTGSANGVGRLTSASSPVSSSQYTYDPQGRLLTDIQRIKPATGANAVEISRTVTYTYDAAGNVTRLTYPSGRQLSITYTGGRPSALGLAPSAGGTAAPMLGSIQWEPFGAARRWLWQLTSTTQLHERFHDSYGRPVRYRLGPNVRDISYDAADRIVGYKHYLASTWAAAPALDQSFGYDELGRLTSITTAAASWTLAYDANGNRTSVVLNGTTSTYTTPATSNRLASLTNPARSFGHDAAGNTTAGGTYSASYNLAGRMATLARAGVTTTYSVDGFGRRVRKVGSTGAGSTVLFVYDQQGQLLGEYDSTGAALREYVWLGTTPVAVFTPDPANTAGAPLVYYIHTDHLDTPRVVTDKAGNARWTWLAEPFGTTVPSTNPQGLGAFAFNLRFPGQYADAESGLHYNYFRDYDGSVGRYTQSDPIGLSGGINTYAYVDDAPTMYTDPDGLQRVLPGPVPLPVPGPMPGRSSTRPIDPSEPGGATYRIGPSWPSWPPNDPPDDRSCPPSSPKDRCQQQYENDSVICRSLKTADAKRRCWESAMERRAACVKNGRIPPLSTWY